MENKISACIVAYNEEKVIERCLKSIVDVVDEIIVVHDGECSDKTLEIAKKYNARIFVQPHHGEAEFHRPFSYEQAQNPWILVLDGDEYLSTKLQAEIRNLVTVEDIDAYAFRWPLYNFKKKRYIKGPYDYQLKTILFRRSNMFSIGISHDAPKTYGKFVKRYDLILEHKPPYDNLTFQKLRNKWLKWGDIQAREILNIANAPIYNYDEIELKPIFDYYRGLIKHPYYTTIKGYIIFDFAKKVIKKHLIGSELINWYIQLMSYINVLYLAHKISYYKRHPELIK